MLNSSLWPINRTLLDATTPGHCGSRSDSNKGVLRIPQSSSITGASPSDCLISYPGHSLGECYPSAELQSMYFTVPADWPLVGLAWFICLMAYQQLMGYSMLEFNWFLTIMHNYIFNVPLLSFFNRTVFFIIVICLHRYMASTVPILSLTIQLNISHLFTLR